MLLGASGSMKFCCPESGYDKLTSSIFLEASIFLSGSLAPPIDVVG